MKYCSWCLCPGAAHYGWCLNAPPGSPVVKNPGPSPDERIDALVLRVEALEVAVLGLVKYLKEVHNETSKP